MIWNRVVLCLNTFVFGGIGIYALVFPHELASLIGLVLQTPAAVTDIRSTYGGFEIGLALFFTYAFRSQEQVVVRCALLVAALSFTGFASSRILGFLVDGHDEILTWVLFFLESAGASLNWIFLRLDIRTSK